METFYVQVDLSAEGPARVRKLVGVVHGRANATEVEKADAIVLQGLAQRQRADLDWQIDRTYSGKYVVRGQSKM